MAPSRLPLRQLMLLVVMVAIAGYLVLNVVGSFDGKLPDNVAPISLPDVALGFTTFILAFVFVFPGLCSTGLSLPLLRRPPQAAPPGPDKL
jgi:hypothetical protein